MALFKKKQQTGAEIRLTPQHDDKLYKSGPDHFLSNETVSGNAIFKLPPGANLSRSKIILKGTIKTSTEDSNHGSLTKGWRTEKLNFLAVVYESKARNLKSDDGVVRVPFKFNLESCARLTAYVNDLPPSVDSRQEGQRPTDNQYDITYTVSATAYDGRGTLATANQKIVILPVSEEVLSESPSDVPGEYFWAKSATQPSKNQKPKSSQPLIEVAGQEPEPLIINADDMAPEGLTEIPFVVKLSPQASEKISRESLPAKCQAKARLVSKTHLTPDGIQQMASQLEFIKIGNSLETRSQTSHDQEVTIPIRRWEECISCSTDPFSVARFSFIFRVDGNNPLVPTFHTPLLSRRYSIDITLSFPDSSNETFKLSLPLQVMHGSNDLDFYGRKKSDVSSFAEVEARL